MFWIKDPTTLRRVKIKLIFFWLNNLIQTKNSMNPIDQTQINNILAKSYNPDLNSNNPDIEANNGSLTEYISLIKKVFQIPERPPNEQHVINIKIKHKILNIAQIKVYISALDVHYTVFIIA